MYFLDKQALIIMEPIQLSALGRTFRVGDLYNYFTDKTVSTGKIFKICYVVSGYVYFVMNSLCHD